MTTHDKLHDRIARLTGSRPVSSTPVKGGYTLADRRVVRFADGRTLFAKAATDADSAGWLRAERRVYAAVRGPFIAAALAWEDGDLPLLLLEDLSAAHWPPPWEASQVARIRETLRLVAATPPPPGLPSLEGQRGEFRGWARLAEDPAPFLALGHCTEAWLRTALPALVAAESGAPLDGDSLLHLDVRSDNLCFTADRAVLVDWNWASRGNADADLAFWAPSLHGEGGPPPEVLLPDAPGLAAAVSGFFAFHAGQPAGGRPPRVRDVQKFQLRFAFPWVVRALRLPAP